MTRSGPITIRKCIAFLLILPAVAGAQAPHRQSDQQSGPKPDAAAGCPASPAAGQARPAAGCPTEGAGTDGWKTWRNTRFDFSICYPSAVFPVSRESPQRHGIVLESRDSAQLIAAGMEYRRATLAEPIRMEKERLTHIALISTSRDLTNGDTGFEVSGTRVDQILYTKAIRTGDRLIAIRFRYPQSLKARYAPIVERVAACLTALKTKT